MTFLRSVTIIKLQTFKEWIPRSPDKSVSGLNDKSTSFSWQQTQKVSFDNSNRKNPNERSSCDKQWLNLSFAKTSSVKLNQKC